MWTSLGVALFFLPHYPSVVPLETMRSISYWHRSLGVRVSAFCTGFASQYSTGMPHFIVLCFIALCRCCSYFYKLKARPSTSKKMTTCFVAVLPLLRWSGNKLVISLRCACNYIHLALDSEETPPGLCYSRIMPSRWHQWARSTAAFLTVHPSLENSVNFLNNASAPHEHSSFWFSAESLFSALLAILPNKFSGLKH